MTTPPMQSRVLAALSACALVLVLAACGSTSSSSPTTTTATSPSTAPPHGACPPGCSLPSDHDALTALASSASLVEIVTVRGVRGSSPDISPDIRTDTVLQLDPDKVAQPTPPALLTTKIPLVNGQAYVVFWSANDHGDCVSALYTYDPGVRLATLAPTPPGALGVLETGGRSLTLPTTASIETVQASMYPTGPRIRPTNATATSCPGA